MKVSRRKFVTIGLALVGAGAAIPFIRFPWQENNTVEAELVLHAQGKEQRSKTKVQKGSTVLDVLMAIEGMRVEAERYPGGVLVHKINGLENTKDHCWECLLDGVLVSSGGVNHQVEQGSVVEWRYIPV